MRHHAAERELEPMQHSGRLSPPIDSVANYSPGTIEVTSGRRAAFALALLSHSVRSNEERALVRYPS